MAEGFEEIELVGTVDFLVRGGLDAKIVSIGSSLEPVKGSHNIRITPDLTLETALKDSADAVVLPGGLVGAKNLGENQAVLDLLKKQYGSGKTVAAICAAPAVFVKAGIARGRKMTCYPALKDHLVGAEFVDQKVVVDGCMVTSQGPGTTFLYAEKLIEILAGSDKADEVMKGALLR